MNNTVEINSDSLKKVTLTLVDDGLGDITREQYDDAINEVLCSAYDEDSAWIDINWKATGSTKIELEFEGYDAENYEHSRAYDREKEYIADLLERAYAKACEDA